MRTPFLPLLLLLAAASTASALDGAVHGRVYGQSAKGENLGPLAGATLELKNASGATVTTATTNSYGYYQIPSLEAGGYRYRLTAKGFKTEDAQRGFVLPADTREFVHDFLLSQDAKAPETVAPVAQNQRTTPAIHGRVYGQNEKGENLGPLPGAKVEILSPQGGSVVAQATANTPGGYYEIKNLPAADYAYRVSAAGFTTEDARRGFTVPASTLEYVHDFLLSKPPPKRFQCDLPVLVVRKISNGKDTSKDVRLPVPNARLVLQPTSGQQAPAEQPYVTDAKGERTISNLPEGNYNVAIDAPECEPFNGTVKMVCGPRDEQIIFELQPCNELLHGYVRTLLSDGWGPGTQAQGARDRAHQRALKAGGEKDARVDYALALTRLSAGEIAAAQQTLAKTAASPQEDSTWDRACQTRLWLLLCQHEARQAAKEITSLLAAGYGRRNTTLAAKDTAHLFGVAAGLLQGPWKELTSPGDGTLLESELLKALQPELRAECQKGRDHVTTEHAKWQAAEEAARSRLITAATAQHQAEVERITQEQNALGQQVAALDRELQGLQATVAQYDKDYRIQAAGFAQQRQVLATQIAPLNARLQQINACLLQDQAKLQAMQQQQMQQQQQQQMQQQQQFPPGQSPTTGQPGMRPGIGLPGGFRPGIGVGGNLNSQAVLAEMQQHQVEIRQIQAQLVALQNQDAQMATQIVNLQNRFAKEAAQAQASLTAKLRQREGLAQQYDALDRRRVADFDPQTLTTPEIDTLSRQRRALKTYNDLPLDPLREELLQVFDCGATKEPAKPLTRSTPSVQEPAFPTLKATRPRAATPGSTVAPRTLPAPQAATPLPALEAPPTASPATSQPAPPATSRRALPGSPAARPAAAVGEPADLVLSNTFPHVVRIFSIAPGADNEQHLRTLQAGEEISLTGTVGQTLVVRSVAGGQEVQRHRVAKKLEVLKLGAPAP